MSEVQLLFLLLYAILRNQVQAYNVRITSWCRSAQRNREVGGVENSLHLVCLALDVVGPPNEVQRLALAWRGIGLDAVQESDHLHLELDGPAVRA